MTKKKGELEAGTPRKGAKRELDLRGKSHEGWANDEGKILHCHEEDFVLAAKKSQKEHFKKGAGWRSVGLPVGKARKSGQRNKVLTGGPRPIS